MDSVQDQDNTDSVLVDDHKKEEEVLFSPPQSRVSMSFGSKTYAVLVFSQPQSSTIQQTLQHFGREHLLKEIRGAPERGPELPFTSSSKAYVSARDLHALDPNVNLHGCSFFVRRNAILVNLNPIKAIIVANCMYVMIPSNNSNHGSNNSSSMSTFNNAEESPLQSAMPGREYTFFSRKNTPSKEFPSTSTTTTSTTTLNSWLTLELGNILTQVNRENESNVAFETKALESLLCCYVDYINQELSGLAPLVSQIGDELLGNRRHHKIPVLESLRQITNVLDKQYARVLEAVHAVDEVLQVPDMMFQMNLQRKRAKPTHGPNLEYSDYENIELLFDTYLQAMETSLTTLKSLIDEVDALNDIKMLHLDQTRNTLMRIELIFSIVTSTAGVGAMVAGIFGMNLNSHVQEEDHWFWGTTFFLLGMLVFFSAGFSLWLFKRGLLSPEV